MADKETMKLETNYALKLFFPNSSFAQIYFEAVANALDAGATEINIEISTDGNIRNPSHLEIIISDNGVGFTPDRFEKFKEIKEPNDQHHKGMGRLVYLKYFSTVEVESYYKGAKRLFTFTNFFDGESHNETTANNITGTKFTFKNFIGDRIKTYDDLRPITLKERFIEHFLPYFIEMKRAEKQFQITIKLATEQSNSQYSFFPDDAILSQNDIPEFVQTSFMYNSLDLCEIKISYWIRKIEGNKESLTIACIDDRTVRLPLLQQNSIPIEYSAIFLIESDMFIGRSDSSRQKLVLPENVSETVFFMRLRKEISHILNNEIPSIKEHNITTKNDFDDKYPHLSGYFEEDTIGLINRDEAIEIAQNRFFKNQKEILDSESLDDRNFEKSLEIASRTLTEYILYRELIIKRLASMSESDDEAKIHNLIVPRYKEFNGDDLVNGIYSNNAWLLDDKFMTFRTILSEKRMDEIIKAITLKEGQERDKGRPDIAMIFSGDPSDKHNVDVVVIEIKKRKNDDKENPYAATQLVKRARKLIDYCPNIQRIWYYAVIEIDKGLAQLLEDMKWIPLFSKGKVFYQDFQVKRSDGHIVPTPTCLLSYDAVINDAAARNHTFLEILKNDIRKARKNDFEK